MVPSVREDVLQYSLQDLLVPMEPMVPRTLGEESSLMKPPRQGGPGENPYSGVHFT